MKPVSIPVCRECGVVLTEENWSTSRSKWRSRICRTCISEYDREYKENNIPTEGKCRKCNTCLTDDNWYPSYRKRHTFQCIKCALERNLEYKRSPAGLEVSKRSHLKTSFGITLEQWDKMWKEQNGNCALCGLPMKIKGHASDASHVDHDHTTGKIRGLIHCDCNLMLGHAHDRIELLQKAVEYLKKHAQMSI